MTSQIAPASRVPTQVALFSPVLNFLLRAHVPLGPNRLVTIRGRSTGLPRTTGLAVITTREGRWVWAPWGEVNWVRNLRASGRATITDHGRTEEVVASELEPAERVAFFRDILGPLARRIPFGTTFIRLVDGVDISDPVRAADGRVVFELHPLP